jgi:hypothetical protein
MVKINKSVKISYWIGIFIVFVTHLYMLGYGMPADQIVGHSILNLVAGCLLAYSWFGIK